MTAIEPQPVVTPASVVTPGNAGRSYSSWLVHYGEQNDRASAISTLQLIGADDAGHHLTDEARDALASLGIHVHEAADLNELPETVMLFLPGIGVVEYRRDR